LAISAPTTSPQFLAASIGLAGDSWPLAAIERLIAAGPPLYQAVGALTFTAAGFTSAAAGDLSLIRMPPGTVNIRTDLSRLVCPAATATSDLDVGISAYTKADGTTQTLQGNLFLDSVDVGGGAINQMFATTLGSVVSVVSRGGFDIVCSFDTANSPASGILYVDVAFTWVPPSRS